MKTEFAYAIVRDADLSIATGTGPLLIFKKRKDAKKSLVSAERIVRVMIQKTVLSESIIKRLLREKKTKKKKSRG